MTAALPVFLNPAAGGGADRAAVEAAFAGCEVPIEVRILDPAQDPTNPFENPPGQRPSIVVAGGGDGTISSVAAGLLDGPAALGVLPLGTLNHFAKDLAIPLDLAQAVRVIAKGDAQHVDVGEVNGRIFLNNASLGLYPRIVLAREDARRRLHASKWPALARASWQALKRPHALEVALTVDGKRLQRRTPFLFVGNNRYELAGLEAGKRRALDGGLLSVHVLRPQSPFGFILMALRTLCGLSTRERDFERFLVEEFEVEAVGDRLEVARDGEVEPMSSPLRFRIRPRALRVIVAKDPG